VCSNEVSRASLAASSNTCPHKALLTQPPCETAHYCLQRQNSPIGCIHINPEQSGHKFSIDKMYKRIPQQSELHPLGFVVLVSPLVPQQWSALTEKWNITQQGARKSFMYSLQRVVSDLKKTAEAFHQTDWNQHKKWMCCLWISHDLPTWRCKENNSPQSLQLHIIVNRRSNLQQETKIILFMKGRDTLICFEFGMKSFISCSSSGCQLEAKTAVCRPGCRTSDIKLNIRRGFQDFLPFCSKASLGNWSWHN
jgi:hypothetical protein